MTRKIQGLRAHIPDQQYSRIIKGIQDHNYCGLCLSANLVSIASPQSLHIESFIPHLFRGILGLVLRMTLKKVFTVQPVTKRLPCCTITLQITAENSVSEALLDLS